MFTFLLIFLWLVLLYGIVSVIVNYTNVKIDNKILKLPLSYPALAVGAIGLFFTTSIVTVDAQDVGILVRPSGVDKDELKTGWHVVMPWNKVYYMDKTVWVYTCAQTKDTDKSKHDAGSIWSPTKDGIKMGFDVSVSWRIDPVYASDIYQNVSGDDGSESNGNERYNWIKENVIKPKLNSAMALTVANYTPIEAYSTKRQEISDKIMERITQETKQYHILIDNVDLREVFYNKEYEKAINDKKLAEQKVLTLIEVTKQKEEELKQAEITKNIAIQQAQGEAEALKIKGDAVAKNPKIVSLEWIEAWKSGGAKVPQFIGGGGGNGNTMFMLNIQPE